MNERPPPGAVLYLEPACFVERPHGLDGRVARLAGSLLWFAAYRATWRTGPKSARAGEALVPVAEMDGWRATLDDAQAERAERQIAALQGARPPLRLGERTIRFDAPQVMGILNLTPDSFSDGGRFEGDSSEMAEAAVAAGVAMAEAGAAIIDVGGESTRPGAPPVWEGDEIARVVPTIERLARAGTAVSVDTRKAAVMEAALAAGAAIINDVSALGYDERAVEVIAAHDCPVVLMHAPSQGSDPHAGAGYADVTLDVFDFLEARIAALEARGIARTRMIADPGIGFGKSVRDNLALTNQLALFQALGVPVLYGASRKRMIGAIDGEAPADARLGGSIALHLAAIMRGAQIVRAHDVPETVQAVRLWRAQRDAALIG